MLVLSATTADEMDAAFASLMQRSVDGLVMGNDQFFQVQHDQVVALAARYRLPTIYEWPEFVRAGGLASYSADGLEISARWEFTPAVCSTAPTNRTSQ